MSAPDARLSAAERAAFADLEAAASAADPALAARLRTGTFSRLRPLLAVPRRRIARVRFVLGRSRWYGAALLAAGLALMLLGLSVDTGLSLAGAVIAAVGIGAALERLALGRHRRPGRPPSAS